MCLAKITGTPKKTSGLGWKVFKVTEEGKVAPSNRGFLPYDYGVWYEATPLAKGYLGYVGKYADISLPTLKTEYDIFKPEDRQDYRNGFHIFLRREDARAWAKTQDEVVRQVEYRQAHTLGQGRDRYAPGPQVVAEEIRILKPRPGGSAYTKVKKGSKYATVVNGEPVTE